MAQDILLLVLLAAPVAAMFFLRINAVMMYLAVCLGAVMVRYVAGSANSLLSWIAPHASPVASSTLQLATFLLPIVATSVFFLFSVKGHVKALVNLIPAAATSVLGVLIAVPLLPASIRFDIQEQALWSQLAKLQALIVGVSALYILFALWSQRRHGHHGHHGGER